MPNKANVLDLQLPKYGRPISLENTIEPDSKLHVMGAHSMISQFLNVKLNYKEDLESLTAGDTHAKRYFCNDDIAFVFNVDIMRAIVNEIDKDKKNEGKGCVVFFQGLRKSLVDKNHPSKGFSFGRPTLIATAYKQDPVTGDLHHTSVEYTPYKKEVADKFEAFEHPGDGTGGTSLQSVNPMGMSPVVHRNCENENSDLCDTDFSINTCIKKDELLKWH